MDQLSKQNCEACNVNAKMLSVNEIDTLMSEVEGWELIVDSNVHKLKRVFHTNNFIQAISFTNSIADIAETESHHPQIIVEYSSVTVLWWTHKINGLHKNDFIMASKTSLLYQQVF